MGFGEQLVSLLAGSLLVVNAFERKSFSFSKAAVGAFLLYRGVTGHGPLMNVAAKAGHALSAKNINIKSSVTVNRPRSEVYAFWRKLSNLPLFMKHLQSVEEIDDKHSYWKANVPGGLPRMPPGTFTIVVTRQSRGGAKKSGTTGQAVHRHALPGSGAAPFR